MDDLLRKIIGATRFIGSLGDGRNPLVAKATPTIFRTSLLEWTTYSGKSSGLPILLLAGERPGVRGRRSGITDQRNRSFITYASQSF